MPENLRGAIDLSGLVRRAQTPAGAEGEEQGEAGGAVATDQNFGEIVERSQNVPVVIEFTDTRMGPSGVDAVVASYGGRIGYAVVDAMANPQLVQAFRVAEIPTFAAVIAGRPVPLFSGLLAEDQLRDLLEQVLQVAAQQGVTGTAAEGDEPAGEPAEPVPAPLPPHHQAAYDAIDAGDYPAAIHEYEQALRENPRDELAAAGLAQVKLLQRLGVDGEEPDEADRAFAAGEAERAFQLVLDAWPAADPEERERLKARMLDYFEILGAEDPRVAPARRRLTSLLF